ncbi:unnamed protein product [Lactuca saligna]|uniref:Leucine-rich repeat-containing N-terminal plant-type domain-containing protein n=1 Tax=Lactuca saligna TaxID=75948 RepID=A0AA35ZDA8_LACSI|nr:unnamed protein product [Lactuca saligna]
MNPCVFIIFSLLLLCLETITSNQLVAAGGGDDNDVRNKCSDKERRALLDFKARLQDPDETPSTWRSEEEEDCCNWSGVTCNNQTGRVIELNISSGGLEGEISNSLLNLSYLTHLDLFSNSFHGIIPTFIGSMTRLRYLHLGWNHLNGTIPRSIGSLRKLRHLDLSDNSHCGIIPLEFGNLTNLQVLNLGSLGKSRVWNLEWLSHLSHLEALEMDGISLAKQNYWIDVILRLRKLISLSLDRCEVSQVVYPYSSFLISSSSSIESLILSNNNLTTSMYRWLFRLTSNKLRILDLSGNILDGIPKYLDIIPLGFWDMWPSQLTYLNLSSNNISGKAPDLSSKCGYISMIDLSSNIFYGPITNVSSTLTSLHLSRNKFYGGISFLCQIDQGFLVVLDLSHNFLSGQIPDCLWHFKELKILNLEHNNLSGRLPTSVGSLIKLESLDLYKNNFSGELPLSLNSCTSLNSLNLGANKFSGNVPLWIGENLLKLYVLILRSNNFFGTISLQLCQLEGIRILDLSVNKLHGTIPSCLDNLTSMVQEGFLPTHNVQFYTLKLFYSGGYHYGERDDKYFDHAMIEWKGYERELIRLLKNIDLSSNNLTGPIPYEVTKLYGLHALNLSKNSLLGEIPETIGQMKQLETLDLSRNNLSGEMPSSMSISRYYGNPRLCGPPLTKNYQGDDESEVRHVIGESEDRGEDMDELWGWFYIGGGTGFVTGFWIACGALLLNHRGRHAFFSFL